jgi:hypothetical protein
MRHVLIGLRAFGEAVFWGTVMSAAGVGDRTCRIVAGVVSGICVSGTLWLFLGREVDEMLGTLLVGPREWLMYVVGPGLLAVAVGAWRGPAVLRSDVPQLRRRGDAGA